jgi:hypothetical protein
MAGRFASTVLALAITGATLGGLSGAQAATVHNGIAPVRTCASLAGLDVARLETSIGAAAEVTREGHQYCSVTGYISPQTRFEVLLPTATWAGEETTRSAAAPARRAGCGIRTGAAPRMSSTPRR